MDCKRLLLVLVAAAWLAPAGANAADAVQVKTGAKQTMEATLYKPTGAGPFPAILVLHTSSGLQPSDQAYASKLADEGYVCLVPDFFQAYGLSQSNRHLTFTAHAQSIQADFIAAIELLKKTPGVQADRIGAVGFSNGGYWAILFAANRQVQAGVGYYGAYTGAGTDKSLHAFQSAITEKSSPVLVLHGAMDSTVPAQNAEYLVSILKKANVPHEFRLYPSAGHSFERGKTLDSEAATDGWERTLRFLNGTLKKP